MRLRSLLLLATLPLFGGEEASFGMVAGVDRPLGRLQSDPALGTREGLGYHGGLQFGGALDHQNDIRVQLVFMHLGGARWPGTGQLNSYDARQLGVDLVHATSIWERHLYVLGGAHITNLHVRYEGPLSPAETRFDKAAPGLRAGLGYSFSRHLQLEATADEAWTRRGGEHGLGMRPMGWARLSAVIQF